MASHHTEERWEQPGLEVRNVLDLDAKEVVVPQHIDMYYPYTPSPLSATPAHLVQETPPPRSRRRWVVIGGAVAVVLVLAAVLGGVFGRGGGGGGGGGDGGADGNPVASGNTINPASERPSAPQRIRRGSALTVTGMRKAGGVDLFLFYQDEEDRLRYSRCDTSRPVQGNGTCWSNSMPSDSFARPGTQLAVSSLLYGKGYNAQTELFYSGKQSQLFGVNFNDVNTPSIGEDSVNTMKISTGINSSLMAYWPWLIYADSSGTLHHVCNRLRAGFSPASEWDNNNINATAMMGSKLAIVPMSSNFSRIALKGGYGVFYQGLDGRLTVQVTDLESPEIDPSYPLSWPTALPSITTPQRSPLAAFSVARPSDALQRVNTYVLYLDGSSNINVLHTDMTSGSPTWRTSQPEALHGADPDTSIACLNMATSPSNAAQSQELLEPASEATNRCYFQKEGVAVEVRLDGGPYLEQRASGEWESGPLQLPAIPVPRLAYLHTKPARFS
ncbi:hypothetical protein B0T16DRAFT_325410 [Cercophora newfieldiana]|uniref:Fucose-specific lectin n=1 Tax=Cercophora newfieldiana TaxID=92897 RepID=A0AA40CUP2_9PEZI|nr:hypothetical protein B0T16DRAFT_325410 [Cercophora newfieldiana]